MTGLKNEDKQQNEEQKKNEKSRLETDGKIAISRIVD